MDRLKKLGFKEDVNFSLMDSKKLGCRFFRTKYENIFITDYDIIKNINLKEHNLLMLIYKDETNTRIRYMLIDLFMLEEKSLIDEEIEIFYKRCKN